MPQVFAALAGAGVVDKMNVVRTAQTSDGAGGFTPGSVTTPYTDVPVAVEATKGARYDAAGKLIAVQAYILTFPEFHNGSKVSIDLATDRLVTSEVGSEPSKVYRIISPAEEVVNTYVCIRES